MKILGEMKRRNVFRIGMVYIVGAWIFIQLGYVIAQNYAAPEWVMGVFITLLVCGFPITLYFTWVFALTTEGIRKESHLLESDTLVRKTGHKLDYITMALLAGVVGMIALDRYMPVPNGADSNLTRTQEIKAPEPEPVIEENSIAVLPFVNMSAEENQEYFSDGLSEELLNVLTQVEGLNVASRTSSFAFKDDTRNIKDIARTLRVANILEGSVRKIGDRLRITAQLIDTTNDRHLWSNSYDRELTDIFAIQDEIANAIVTALTAELGIGLEVSSVGTATSNLDAYDLYLRARELFIARENLPVSWRLLEQATRMDPQFVRAWEALAAVRSVATSWFPGDGIDHEKLALEAAYRALELDPNLSMAHAVIGMKHQVTGEGYAGAIASLDKAIENNPKNATAWLWRGITLKDMGYIDKALADFEQCLQIDAAYHNCAQYRATSLLSLGRIEEAVIQLEDTFKDNFHSTDGNFVSYYVHTGQKKLAYLVASLAVRNPSAPVKHWIEAIETPDEDHSYRVVRFNEWGEAFNIDVCDMGAVPIALKQEQCFTMIKHANMMWHPDTAYFRKSDAFKGFVTTHLMPYWKEHGFPPQCADLGEGDLSCS